MSRRVRTAWLPLFAVTVSLSAEAHAPCVPATSVARRTAAAELLQRIEEHRLAHVGGAFLVIEIAADTFYLYDRAHNLLRIGPCSSGSDATLEAQGRRWSFRTPRGLRTVSHKARDPVWAKPDWAFIEERLPVPTAGSEERLVHGMLGEYALDIGAGYLVHGSPFQRGLGEKNTHGCIRLGDEDLELVYESLAVGDRVLLR